MQNTERRRQFFRSFEAKSLRSRSVLTQLSDKLTSICGSTPFLVFHVVFFTAWVLVNTGKIPAIIPFDPYPFGFLTMVVSLEAIFLSIFVLVSQNRSSYIGTIRDEVQLRVNLIAEEDITKILQILAEMRGKMGIKENDADLNKMLERIDTNYIERSVTEQLESANKPIVNQLIKEFPDILLYPVKKPVEIASKLKNREEKK